VLEFSAVVFDWRGVQCLCKCRALCDWKHDCTNLISFLFDSNMRQKREQFLLCTQYKRLYY